MILVIDLVVCSFRPPTILAQTNVGNVGDILKHAALVRMLYLVRRRSAGEVVNYLDTHTYLLEADCANLHWRRHCDALLRDHVGYREYIELEASQVERGRYRCSSRLALEVLGAGGTTLFLSEADTPTLQALRHQLADLDITPGALHDDMLVLADRIRPAAPGPLVALVDPFYENEDQWQRIWWAACSAVGLLHAPGRAGLIELYRWNRGEPAAWPSPPEGFIGPIAEISRPAKKPGAVHTVAVYATPELAEEALEQLELLGGMQPMSTRPDAR